MRIKDEVLAKGAFDIRDETKTRFWMIHGSETSV